MTRFKSSVLLVSAAYAALCWAMPAIAQEAPQSTATGESLRPKADEEAPAYLGEIVVTARRRAEAIQKVPITITAFSGEELQRRGVHSVEELRTLAPGVNVGGQGRDEAQFFVRGQGPGPITAGQHNFSSVATYFAEVPTVTAGPGVFYDLASVQVVKGPQGTLFGRNTTGGAVLFEPMRPKDSNGGYVQAAYGNYNDHELEFALNSAVVPGAVALRLSGQVVKRDGYTESIVTGQKLDGRAYEALRGSLLLTPGDRFENLTIIDYRHRDASGSSEILRAVDPSAPFGAIPTAPALAPLLGLPFGASVAIPLRAGGAVNIACLSAVLPGCPTGPFGSQVAAFQAAYHGGALSDPATSGFGLIGSSDDLTATLARQQALGVRRNLTPVELRTRQRDIGVTNRTSFDLTDTVTLKNIIAYRESDSNGSTDFDGTPLNSIATNYILTQPWSTGIKQFTEEFQVQGRLPTKDLSYILGYYHENSKPGFDQIVSGYTLGSLSTRISNYHDTSDAVFAHVEFNPTPLVGVSGGIRQTWDKRQTSLSVVDAAGACTQVDPSTGGLVCPLSFQRDFSALTYDTTINVQPMREVMIYGSYRHGFKSGGINLPAPTGLEVFAPEKVDSFEVGLKANWDVGAPVRTNLALFRDNYRDIQIQESVTYQAAGGTQIATSIVRNAPKAINQGVEFEAMVAPVRGFTLSGFVSYLDAHSTVSIPGVIIAGRQRPNQPQWKYGVSGSFERPLKNGVGTLEASADWAWQDEVFTASTPGLVPVNPAYGLLNARITWRDVMGRPLDLSLFGSNLANKTYVLGGFPIAALGLDAALYGEPRMYGVSARIRFGQN